jgi:hypothetical protein
MTTTTYPDGSQLSSTALSKAQIETLFQQTTAQMLGIVIAPWAVNLTLTAGQSLAVAASLLNLYAGESITGPGIPAGTLVLGVTAPNGVTLSNKATISGASAASVIDPLAWSKVRIGWQQQGQPAFGINDDVAIVRCVPVDDPYSRVRDLTYSDGEDGTTVIQTDVFTRAWRTFWTFYGANSLDNARAVRSALLKAYFVDAALATSNLYIQPSIAEPLRVPEDYQSQWWERADLFVLFNEQITETYAVNAVASVEVKLYDNQGNSADFSVEQP